MYRNILFSGIQLLATEADKKTKFSNRSTLMERDKKEFGERFSAEAVEMETSAIAKVATDKNLLFLSVRAISDSVEQEILDSSSFLGSDGEISKLKAGWYVLTHPGSIASALSLRSQTLRATRTMTEFVFHLL